VTNNKGISPFSTAKWRNVPSGKASVTGFGGKASENGKCQVFAYGIWGRNFVEWGVED
jgi:hypothetical protein